GQLDIPFLVDPAVAAERRRIRPDDSLNNASRNGGLTVATVTANLRILHDRRAKFGWVSPIESSWSGLSDLYRAIRAVVPAGGTTHANVRLLPGRRRFPDRPAGTAPIPGDVRCCLGRG